VTGQINALVELAIWESGPITHNSRQGFVTAPLEELSSMGKPSSEWSSATVLEEALAALRRRHDERVQERYAGMSVRQALEQARADMRREGPGEPSLD
jgi:hypothetical protein